MTISALVALLKIGEKPAFTMAQSGELRGPKVCDQWRLRRADLGARIDRQLRPAAPDGELDD